MNEDLQSTCAAPTNSTRIDSVKINVNISSNELVQTSFNCFKTEEMKMQSNF